MNSNHWFSQRCYLLGNVLIGLAGVSAPLLAAGSGEGQKRWSAATSGSLTIAASAAAAADMLREGQRIQADRRFHFDPRQELDAAVGDMIDWVSWSARADPSRAQQSLVTLAQRMEGGDGFASQWSRETSTTLRAYAGQLEGGQSDLAQIAQQVSDDASQLVAHKDQLIASARREFEADNADAIAAHCETNTRRVQEKMKREVLLLVASALDTLRRFDEVSVLAAEHQVAETELQDLAMRVGADLDRADNLLWRAHQLLIRGCEIGLGQDDQASADAVVQDAAALQCQFTHHVSHLESFKTRLECLKSQAHQLETGAKVAGAAKIALGAAQLVVLFLDLQRTPAARTWVDGRHAGVALGQLGLGVIDLNTAYRAGLQLHGLSRLLGEIEHLLASVLATSSALDQDVLAKLTAALGGEDQLERVRESLHLEP